MTHSALLWQIDAFTDRPFTGNPAAVCLLDTPREAGWMQSVAAEMNLSETAFVAALPDSRPGSAERAFALRWFTPAAEVELCGHATLAAAWVLWESGVLRQPETAHFDTASGRLSVRRCTDGRLEMDFPSTPPTAWPEGPGADVAAALGVAGTDVVGLHRSRFDLLVEMASAHAVEAVSPRFEAIAELPARGVIVTATAAPGSRYDFVSRFFAPAVGVPEDPVTGSAHCALAPFWGRRLQRVEMLARQVSRRGGEVALRWSGGDRVQLAGRAVTVFRGELRT